MNKKLLEIWCTFDANTQELYFYSIITDDDIDTISQSVLHRLSLYGSVYMGDDDNPYIEIATNVLSGLIVPEALSMDHQKYHKNTTYRVGVFWINGRIFVVEGCDHGGHTVYDDMQGYTCLFTAIYNRDSDKWIVPLSEIVNTFNHETPISLGINKNIIKHIRQLCQIFEW